MNTETATAAATAAAPDVLASAAKAANMVVHPATQPQTQQSSLDRPDVNLVEHSPFRSMHAFGLAQRMAVMLASSSIVPDDYRTWVFKNDQWNENPAAIGNCFIAIELANRLRTSPILIMQQVDMIHGRPALRGVMLIGLINASGEFTKLRFEQAEAAPGTDEYGYRAVATDKETNEVLYGPWITWKMVNSEGWPLKKGSKWKTMPEQMFQYRAAAFWSRLFAPHITLGLYEVEEAQEIAVIEHVPLPQTRAQTLNARLEAADAAAASQEPASDVVADPHSTGTEADAESDSGADSAQTADKAAAPDPVADAKPGVRNLRGRRRTIKPAEAAAPGPEAENDEPPFTAPDPVADPEPESKPETAAAAAPDNQLFGNVE